MGYIYLRTNLVNGKKYVGQAKDIKDRNYVWNNLSHHYAGKAIDAARAKYGIDAFDFEIIKECEDEELNYWEMYYVKEYNSKTPNGYNMTDGGDSVYEITEETRKKIGDALRGRKLSPEHVAKVAAALRGKKCSEETKAKMSAAHRGKHYPKIAAAKSKPVQALDKATGKVIMEFPSAREAQRQYGFNASHITACCRNCYSTHKGNVYKGYIWRFAV